MLGSSEKEVARQFVRQVVTEGVAMLARLLRGLAESGQIDILEAILEDGTIVRTWPDNEELAFSLLTLPESVTEVRRIEASCLVERWIRAHVSNTSESAKKMLSIETDPRRVRLLLGRGLSPNTLHSAHLSRGLVMFTSLGRALRDCRHSAFEELVSYLSHHEPDVLPMYDDKNDIYTYFARSVSSSGLSAELYIEPLRYCVDSGAAGKFGKHIGATLRDFTDPNQPLKRILPLSADGTTTGTIHRLLMAAARFDTPDTWRILMRHGKSYGQVPADLANPSSAADLAMNERIIRNMVQDGVAVDSVLCEYLPGKGDSCTMLHVAVRADNSGMTAVLLRAGADPHKSFRLGARTVTAANLAPGTEAGAVVTAWISRQALEKVASQVARVAPARP